MDLSGDGSITLDRRAFKALASETRVEILKRLDGTQRTVSDLARELDMNKATMFQHLEQLVEVGLVNKDSERDRASTVKEAPNEAPVQGPPKKWVYYRLSWKGKNVLHPERVRIAIMLSIVAVSCLLVALIYLMTVQAPGPGSPEGKDTRAPLVVGWNVDPVRTDSGIVNVRLTVSDDPSGKVSGLDENATVLRWGVASDAALPEPDLLPWTGLDRTVQGRDVRASIAAIDWSLRGGKHLVVSVELKDLAGNAASYRFSERVAPAGGPDLRIPQNGIAFDRSGSHQFRLSVRLENAGPSNATDVALSVFSRDPDSGRTGKAASGLAALASGHAAFIGAGGSETVNLTVDSNGLASRTVYVMVDPDDRVPETTEANNVLAAVIPDAIPIRPAPRPMASEGTPGMMLPAAALALGVAALLARRRMRHDAKPPSPP